MGSAAYLQGVLEDVLASASAAVTQTRTGRAAPDLQTISHGAPVVDACSGTGLLAVYLEDLEARYREQPGTMPSGRCAVSGFARIVVELWRCVPVPNELGYPPLAADERDAAEALLVDAWCLWTGLLQDALSGSIVPGSLCDTVVVEPLQALEPEGGAGGVQVRLVVQLLDGGPPSSS